MTQILTIGPTEEGKMMRDSAIIQGIKTAIVNTRHVCAREHIKAVNRFERVDLFVTALRRELTLQCVISGFTKSEGKQFVRFMTEKRQWYDAGILDENERHKALRLSSYYNSRTIDWPTISSWVAQANKLAEPTEDEEIQMGMSNLTDTLASMRYISRKAECINADADQVLNNLGKILATL